MTEEPCLANGLVSQFMDVTALVFVFKLCKLFWGVDVHR